MLSTYLSYQLIARDLAKALDRVENQPVVERETKYYLENITKVKSIDEFVKDDRLFRYAMKAHGLEDMTYAKAFMVKALKEGVDRSRQLRQQAVRQALCGVRHDLQFRRPRLAGHGLQQGAARDSGQLRHPGRDRRHPARLRIRQDRDQLLPRQHRQGEVRQGVHGRHRLLTYAMAAYELEFQHRGHGSRREDARWRNARSRQPRQQVGQSELQGIRRRLRLRGHGRDGHDLQPRPAAGGRQVSAPDAGGERRRAERGRAPGALFRAQGARASPRSTRCWPIPRLPASCAPRSSLPDCFASADIDKQVKFFEQKLNIEDFSDPEKLGEFLTRFTSLWEINNPTSPALTSASVLFSQPVEFGISTNIAVRHPVDEELDHGDAGRSLRSPFLPDRARAPAEHDRRQCRQQLDGRLPRHRREVRGRRLGTRRELDLLRLRRRHLSLRHQGPAARDRQPVRLRHPGRRLVRHRDAGRHGDDPRRPLHHDGNRPAGHHRRLSVLDAGGAPIQLDPRNGPPTAGADGTLRQDDQLVGAHRPVRLRPGSEFRPLRQFRHRSRRRAGAGRRPARMSASRRASSRNPTSIRCWR